MQLLRSNASKKHIRSSSEFRLNFCEHQIETEHMDVLTIPQRTQQTCNVWAGTKDQYHVPALRLVPDNKYRESFLKLLHKQPKVFNKVSNLKFKFDRNTYEKVRESQERQLKRNLSNASVQNELEEKI